MLAIIIPGIIVEFWVLWLLSACLGVWACGALMYSWMLHVAIPIMNGSLRAKPEEAIIEGHDRTRKNVNYENLD